MGNLNQLTPVVVVYRKRPKYGKIYMEVFQNVRVDDIIDKGKRKPLIPHKYELLEIGVGLSFESTWKIKYKL